jgi:hypothetical protein
MFNKNVRLVSEDERNQVRNRYRKQLAIVAWDNQSKFSRLECPIYRIGFNREAYVTSKGNAALSTFAILRDGKWQAKGEMRWFGCATEDITQNDWNLKTLAEIRKFPDNTMLTIVDCHI